MNIFDVDRANFRQVRLDHRINQQDIAKRAHVSKSTVCHYESRNTGRLGSHIEIRKDNERMILRALVDMINEGFKSIDVRGGKLMGSVAGTGMSTSPALREGKVNLSLSGEDDEHLIFIDNIRKWLMTNNITIKEFCKFVGANRRILEIDFNRGKPVSEVLKKKIFDATGWRYEDILSGKINEGGEKMKDLETVGEVFDKLDKKTKDYVYKEVDDAINKTLTEEQERYLKQDHKAALEAWEKSLGLTGESKETNTRYIYQDGKCFKECDIVTTKHVCIEITRDEFMEGISDAKTEKS